MQQAQNQFQRHNQIQDHYQRPNQMGQHPNFPQNRQNLPSGPQMKTSTPSTPMGKGCFHYGETSHFANACPKKSAQNTSGQFNNNGQRQNQQ
jgi:hypothetical protein